MDPAAPRRYDRRVSGKGEGAPDVEPHLTLPPTSEERLAALEAERELERAAIQDLEATLRDAVGAGVITNERARFRRSVFLGFVLGFMGLFTLGFLLLARMGPC